LRWALADDTDGAEVEICRDRACTQVVTTFTANGTSGAPANALAPGVYFWRAHGTEDGAVGDGASPVWEFFVGARSAPVDTSWGTVPDVDGDGYADVLVGTQPTDGATSVVVDVFRGGAGGVAPTPVTTLGEELPSDLPFPTLRAASAGDVNGDGFADVVVVVMESSESGGDGSAFVYLGGPGGLSSTPSAPIHAPPTSTGYFLGASVTSVGDVNGDGYADILVNVAAEPGDFVMDADEAYVFLGGASGLSPTPAITLAARLPFGASFMGSWFSFASAGDVNGDGFGDVVVGSGTTIAPTTGEIDVYAGGAGGLSGAPSTTIVGPNATQTFGYSVASAGDVDGDGLADVVVGSDPGQAGVTTLFVFTGTTSGLSVTPATMILDPAGDVDAFGWAVASAGDVNGDGFGDLVVSSPPDVVDLFLGAASGLSATVSLSLPVPSALDPGFARSLTGAGDVNGDGFADLLVGSSGVVEGDGSVFLYLGAPSGMATTPAATLEPPAGADGSGFGVVVARVESGRVNPNVVR
jgi:hypothetical protein